MIMVQSGFAIISTAARLWSHSHDRGFIFFSIQNRRVIGS